MSRAASKGRSAGGLVVATVMLLAVAFASPASAQSTDGLIPDHDWTDEQIAEMLALIDLTEQVLPETFPAFGPRSEIEAELESRGYFNFGVQAPGGYWHMINPGFILDNSDLVNPETAESLVYQNAGGGNWELVSAMYMGGPDDDVSDLPDDVSWLPGWHGHDELCTWDTGPNPGTLAGITFPDDADYPNCPEGSSIKPTPVMMHVWIVDNGVCDHRFGGIGVGGIHCDVVHDHGNGGNGHDHDGNGNGHDGDGDGNGHDHGDEDGDGHDGHTAPPAQPVAGSPSFTG